MQRTMRPHIALLAAALFAALAASPVAAAASAAKTDGKAQTAETEPQTGPMTTGSVSSSAFGPQESRKKKLEDCMAIWDRGTHMTKREWRRTCNTQLDEDPGF
jgi:hypothetical protein